MSMIRTNARCEHCLNSLAKRSHAVLLAGVVAALPVSSAAAADEIFLSIQGVPGESTDAHHRGEIEVLSYMSPLKYNAFHSKAATTAETKLCLPVTLTKYVDAASPRLFLSLANAQAYAKAVITFRRQGQPPVEYFRVTLSGVKVTEIEHSNSRLNFPEPAPPRAIEKVSLRGQKVTLEYFMPQADGRLERQVVGWDCALSKGI